MMQLSARLTWVGIAVFSVVSIGCQSLGPRSIDNRNPKKADSTPDPTNKPVLEPTGTPTPNNQDIEVPTVSTLQIEDKDGVHSFQVTYSYNETLKYQLLFVTTLGAEEFAKLPAKVKYAIYQDEAADYITDWIEIDRDTVRGGTITFTDQAILKKLIPHQSNVDLIFGAADASGKVVPRYLLPIGTLCEQYEAKYFKNETDPAKTCFDLTEADVKAKAPNAFQ